MILNSTTIVKAIGEACICAGLFGLIYLVLEPIGIVPVIILISANHSIGEDALIFAGTLISVITLVRLLMSVVGEKLACNFRLAEEK